MLKKGGKPHLHEGLDAITRHLKSRGRSIPDRIKPSRIKRRKSFQPSFRCLAYESLEARRLLSGNDLTTEIVQLLQNKPSTTPIDLGNATLGNDLSFNDVTVTFGSPITQSGADWSATVSVSATSASLAVGSAVSAQINGTAGSPGISGSYTLTDQPADQGAFQLTASEFNLSVSRLLTAQASDISIDYNPSAPAGQELVQIGSLSATLVPFDNATATVDNLEIFDDGFSLADGTVTAPPITLGSILSIDQPSLTLQGVGYSDGAFTGTVGLSAASATLFPGASTFSASATTPSGSYSLDSQTLTLSADSLRVNVGKVLQATGAQLNFSLDDSGATPAATFDAKSIMLSSPDFPDATGEIGDFQGTNAGFSIGSATLTDSDVTLGGILDFQNLTLGIQNFDYTTDPNGGAPTVSGTISVGADTITLFPGQTNFSTTIGGFSGSYDISAQTFDLAATSVDLTIAKVVKADSTNVSFTLDDSGAKPAVTFDAKSITLSSPDFPNATGEIDDLHADNTGFSVASASLTDADVTLGGILELRTLTLGLQDFSYTTGPNGGAPTVGGTIQVSAGTINLFPGQSTFSTTVVGFMGSYNIDQETMNLSATSVDLKIGDILDASSTDLDFSLDVSQAPAAFTLDIKQVTLTSARFSATGEIDDLHADNTGFSVASATLTDSSTYTLGGILSIGGLSLGVQNFVYATDPNGGAPTVTGTITFGAQTISLFSGQSAFSTNVTGLSGSYDIGTQALDFQLNEVDISVSDIFMVTADNVEVDTAPGDFALSVGSAMASVPKLAGFEGAVTDLTITPDGFNVGSASLSATGTITVGKVISISGPSATITNIGYSSSNGAQFNGDVDVSVASASLKLGNAVQASVTGLAITVGLMSSDYGQFMVQASSASFQLGSYVTLTADGAMFNTDPGSGDIADFDSVTGELNVGSLSFSGTGTDFGIDSSGNFVTLPGFGVSVNVTDPSGQLQWPSFLPIQLSKLALNWPNFDADPTNFTIDLSASLNASLAGITLAGSVQDAVIDINKLKNGQFPVTSIGGAGFSASGSFAGATVKAEGFLATATVTDSSGNTKTELYGGIDGGLDFAGLAGFEIRLGLSQDGPLDVFAEVDAPIILDPDSGLAVTNLSAGINFGSPLTTPDSAKDLGAAAQGILSPTLTQWESQLAMDVANNAKVDASWDKPPTLLTIQGGATIFDAYASTDAFELTGNIAFDTTGKLLASGTVTLGGSVKVNGSVFIDLSQVASGKAELLINVTAPADTPIVTAYGEVDFEFDGPVLSQVQVPSGSSTPQLGTGLVLDGSTGYGSATNVNLNNSSFTVEFWAKRNTTGQEEYIIGQAPSASTTALSIGFDTNNNFVVNSGGSTLSFPAGVDTSWHQWAVTFDATTGARTIYRDGIEEASDTAQDIQNASTTLLVGKSGSIFFNGGVDEVRVWSVARAAADIQSNLGLTTVTSTTGLLADWSFSEGQGTTAADSSGNGNTLDARRRHHLWANQRSPGPANYRRARPLRSSVPAFSSTAPMLTSPPAASTSTTRRSPSSSGPSRTTPAGWNTSSTRAILPPRAASRSVSTPATTSSFRSEARRSRRRPTTTTGTSGPSRSIPRDRHRVICEDRVAGRQRHRAAHLGHWPDARLPDRQVGLVLFRRRHRRSTCLDGCPHRNRYPEQHGFERRRYHDWPPGRLELQRRLGNDCWRQLGQHARRHDLRRRAMDPDGRQYGSGGAV